MNTLRTVLASALIAGGCVGLSAQAADNSGNNGKTAPSREQVQQNGQQPSAGTLDDNAQRAHSPSQSSSDKSATRNSRADKSSSSSSTATNDASSASGRGTGETWDWAQIDTDHDNSVSPDEMQKFLDAKWAANKSGSGGSASKDASTTSSTTSTGGSTATSK